MLNEKKSQIGIYKYYSLTEKIKILSIIWLPVFQNMFDYNAYLKCLHTILDLVMCRSKRFM